MDHQRHHQQSKFLQQISQPGEKDRDLSEENDFEQEEPNSIGRQEALNFLNEANLKEVSANRILAKHQQELDQDNFTNQQEQAEADHFDEEKEQAYGDFEPSSYRNDTHHPVSNKNQEEAGDFRNEVTNEVNRLYYKAQNFEELDGRGTKIEFQGKAPIVEPNQFLEKDHIPSDLRKRSQSDLAHNVNKQKVRPSIIDDKSELEPLDQDQPIPFSDLEKSDSEVNEDLEKEGRNQKHLNVFNTIQSTPSRPIQEDTHREISSRINMTQYSIHQPKQKSTIDQNNLPTAQLRAEINIQSQIAQQNNSNQNLQIFIQSIDQQNSRQEVKYQRKSYQQAGIDQITESVPKPGGDETPTVIDELNKYKNPYKLEKRPISETNSNQHQNEISSNHSRDYFSFVERQQRNRNEQEKADFVTNVYKNQYQVSITNPYIMHRNSPIVRDKDSASLLERGTPQLAPHRNSSDIQNSNSSQKESRKQRPSEVKQKLEQIEMQVQQKQLEINRQRQQAKYTGVHIDYFKPEANQQADMEPENLFGPAIFEKPATENKNTIDIESNQQQERVSDLEESMGTKRMTYGYHSNQRTSADFNNDYYKKVISKQIHVDSRTSKISESSSNQQRLKQTKSMPISQKKQNSGQKSQVIKQQQSGTDRNSQVSQMYSIKKAILNLEKQQSDKQYPVNQMYNDAQGNNNQSLEDIVNSSDYMNKTIMSRQLMNNFNLNNSVQLDSEVKERNQLFANSEFRDNEKNYTMIDDDDFADQTLTFGHENKQMQSTDKTAMKKQMISTKDSGNIRNIISTIEKNKELSHLDLSLDLKSQMKQCSTTRRDAQQFKDENFLFEQYGLSSNIVIHPQDRKRLQDTGRQGPHRAIKSGSNLVKNKNMKSVKNLKSLRQSSQMESQPGTATRIEKQASLTAKKQQKSQSSATKKKMNKSDRKSIIKKEISLYHESDDKVQISHFIPQEMVPSKKTTGRKKWLPSIDHLVDNNDKSSSSTSDLPQPQQYTQIAPQPMDVQPKMHTSDQSPKNSRESMVFSEHSSNSNISLIEDKQSQVTPNRQINQSDNILHNFNSLNSRSVHNADLNNTQNQISKSYVQLNTSPSPGMRPSQQRTLQQQKDIQDEILQHLLKEEDILYKYATESTAEIQHSENSIKTQSPEHSSRNKLIIYQKLLIDARIEKPRFILFARQLQVSFMITRALIRVLPATLMQRFEAKIKALCQNIHQSFLLIIDLILKQFQSEMSRQDQFYQDKRYDINQSVDFKLLRNITSKKIKSKDNFARTLTIFRQNNEINVLYLKKIIKYILDSYSTDCVPFKPVALDFQEIIRINYGSANTAAGTQSSNREESKTINYSVLAQKEKEILELHTKLQEQIEALINKPGVIINRQVINASNAREPIHMSPNKNEEEVEQQSSPQPQTYRHLSPIKTTQENFAAKDHEILKRCKSTSKNMQINKTHLRSTQVQKQNMMPSREIHNMSMSSMVQKQRMNPIISQNVYRGLNEMPTDNQSRRNPQVSPQQSDLVSQYSQAQNQNLRINDLISGTTSGKYLGVLAQRRNSKKQSTSPNIKNNVMPIRKIGQTLQSNASVMNLGQSGKYSAMNYNENNYEQISDIELNNAHSTERIERSSNYTFKTIKSMNKPESQQRTVSSQAPATSAKTQSTLGADYIRKKYDPQGYRRINQNTYGSSGQKYQCRFNDRERNQKFSSNDQKQQLKVKIGDNRQLNDLNTSVNNTSMVHQAQPTSGISQKRGSLGGHVSPLKGQINTFGSPQKVNSLMKRYGSTNKIQTIQAYQQSSAMGSHLQSHDSYQSKAKIVPSQQATQHQFNKVQNNFKNQQIQHKAGSKTHPVQQRGVLSNRSKPMVQQQQELSPESTQNSNQNWGFMLPESKDFILRMSNDPGQQEMVDQEYSQMAHNRGVNKSILPSNRADQQQPIAQITNVNNNINFYGTVVNHVYQPGDTGRESQSVEQNIQGQFFSPPKQQQQMAMQNQIGSHLQSSNMKNRGRLTTAKKSSQVNLNNRPETMNQHQFNEYILDQMDEGQQILMQDPDSGLFKQSSQDSKVILKKQNKSNFDEHQYDQSMMIENLDNSMDIVTAQNNKSSFAQSFVFDSNSPTMVSPEKRMQGNINITQRSIERQSTEQRQIQSNRKVTTVEKSVQLQYKMHSTGIGSGIKNLKQKQQSLMSHSKTSHVRSYNDKLATSKRKDTRKEVVKPMSRSNMPQSQRDVPQMSNMIQRNTINSNFSHRNSFELKQQNTVQPASDFVNQGQKVEKVHNKMDSSVQPLPEQPPQQSERTKRDYQEEIIEYNKNLLQVEEQTNVSSSIREIESVTDIRNDAITPVPDQKPMIPASQPSEQSKDYDEEEEPVVSEEPQDKDNHSNDVSNIHNTSNVEAEIDQDDEQALIDAEYQRLRKLVKVPYLPALSQTELSKLPNRAKCMEDIYTLVLDLDETLIHFEMDEDVDPAVEEPGYYLIRPGAIKFLNELSEYYELVVFTAAMPDYADWILDNVDRQNKISFRLYRQHSTPFEDYAMKDLTKLGRDLSKTMIIDNLAENFNQITPLNGIWVESWYDDMDDIVLQLLIPFLIDIVKNKVDVRLLLTDVIKEQVLYKKLDEGKPIPAVKDILKKYSKGL